MDDNIIFYDVADDIVHEILTSIAHEIAPVTLAPDRTYVQAADLPFYEQFKLYNLSDLRLPVNNEYFMLYKPQCAVLLDGTNGPIYKINRIAPIKLDQDSLASYIRFCFRYINNPPNPFILVEDMKDIEWLPDATDKQKSEVAAQLMPITYKGMDTNGLYALTATIMFTNALFRANIKISPREMDAPDPKTGLAKHFLSGEILMLPDELLLEGFSVHSIQVDDTENSADDASQIYENAATTKSDVHKEDHPDTARSYKNMGTACEEKGDYNGALEHFEKALAIQLKEYMADNADTANTYDNIGWVYIKKCDFDHALEYYEKALAIWMNLYPEDYPDAARTYYNIGWLYANKCDYDRALEHYEKALKIYLKEYSEDNPDVAGTYYSIGWIYAKKCDCDHALEYYEKALRVYKEDDPSIVNLFDNIGDIYAGKRNYNRALEFYEKALNIRMRVYEDRPESSEAANNLASVYMNMAIAFSKTGNTHEAGRMVTEGLDLIKQMKSTGIDIDETVRKYFIFAKRSIYLVVAVGLVLIGLFIWGMVKVFHWIF
jgi:tetratricopeptide (TPR) repeat protein